MCFIISHKRTEIYRGASSVSSTICPKRNMYGLILENLAEYIRQVYGEDRWEEIRRQASVDQPSFSVHQVYPENFIHSKIAQKNSNWLISGTRRDGKGVLRPNGRTLRRIRRSVWLRSRALGTGTTREGLPQRPG